MNLLPGFDRIRAISGHVSATCEASRTGRTRHESLPADTSSTRNGDAEKVGESRVYLVPDSDAAVKRRGPVPLTFTDPDSSGLTVTVKPGKNQLDPIVLKRTLVARNSR